MLLKESPQRDDLKMFAMADAIATFFEKRHNLMRLDWNRKYALNRAWFVIFLGKIKSTLKLQSSGEFRCRNIFVPLNYLDRK